MATAIVPLRQHWLEKGARCGCPAMRGTRYCYSHRLEQARDAALDKDGELAVMVQFEARLVSGHALQVCRQEQVEVRRL